IRFRKDLSDAAESALPAQESDLLADLEKSLRDRNAQRVREDLAGLYDVNLKYIQFEHQSATNRIRKSLIWLLGLGAGGCGIDPVSWLARAACHGTPYPAARRICAPFSE